MDTLSSTHFTSLLSSCSYNNQTHLNTSVKLSNNLKYSALKNTGFHGIKIRELKVKVKALSEVSATSVDPIQAQVTWQIVVGALAGVIPFIVAGIEFSKRIVAQKRCEVCGGSGLVLRDNKYYFRCPGCGGFLPWQFWRRFFSG